MTRKRRLVSPEERALWDSVARRAEPLHKRPPTPSAAPPPKPSEPPKPQADKPPLPDFTIGSKVDHRRDHDLLPSLAQDLGRMPVRMDDKTHRRMKRGKLRPEARLDLHGMTLAEAHPALMGFILGAQARGQRLVLVITGKGKHRDEPGPIPQRFGALRHQVPQWLRMPPLSPVVLDVTQAHISHGGSGAYYVYLRRSR